MQNENFNVERIKKSIFSAFIGFAINIIVALIILYIWKGRELFDYLLSIFAFPLEIKILGLAFIGIVPILFCIGIGITFNFISFPINKYTEEILVIVKQPYGSLLISCGAGISEELLFRGAILGGLLTILDTFTSIFLVSFIFMVMHIPQYKKILLNIIVFFLGVSFSILYVYTNSLWPPMIAHILYNYVICLWIRYGYLKLEK